MTVCSNIKYCCCSSSLILKSNFQNPPTYDRLVTVSRFSLPGGKVGFTYIEAGCAHRYLAYEGEGYKLLGKALLICHWLLITLYF